MPTFNPDFPPTTLLSIIPDFNGAAFVLTPYSARGVTQTLEPITGIGGSGGNVMGSLIRRDVSGNLMDLTKPQFRKYQSTITCKDTNTPVFDDAWLGHTVTVHCAAELNFRTSTGSPTRDVVSGSERVEGSFTYYRPILSMMVVGVRNAFAEYPADYQWQIDLQEV